jgi:hypothetical protein
MLQALVQKADAMLSARNVVEPSTLICPTEPLLVKQ